MFTEEIEPSEFTEFSVQFLCPQCGRKIKSQVIKMPQPKSSGENDSDSANYSYGDSECKACKLVFPINITVKNSGGDIEMPDLPADYDVSIYGKNDEDLM